MSLETKRRQPFCYQKDFFINSKNCTRKTRKSIQLFVLKLSFSWIFFRKWTEPLEYVNQKYFLKAEFHSEFNKVLKVPNIGFESLLIEYLNWCLTFRKTYRAKMSSRSQKHSLKVFRGQFTSAKNSLRLCQDKILLETTTMKGWIKNVFKFSGIRDDVSSNGVWRRKRPINGFSAFQRAQPGFAKSFAV